MAHDNGRTGGGGGEGAGKAVPPSRAERVASRGDAPSPEVMGEMAWALAQDVVTGAAETRQVAGACRAMQTLVSVARNASPLDDLCERMGAAAKDRAADEAARAEQSRRERVAELERELAELKR